MMVMTMAITPSENASNLDLDMTYPPKEAKSGQPSKLTVDR